MKKMGKRIMSIGLSLVMSAALFLAVGVHSFAYTETTGTVSSDNVKVRQSASTTASQVSSLKNGDKVEIVDEATDASGYVWYKIRVNKNEYGYVRSDLVSKSGGSSSSSSGTSTSSSTSSQSSAASLPETQVTATDSRTATITEDSVNVRQGAGTAYNSVGKVTKGETVTITGEATGTDNKTWYQVTFGSSNKTGFIRSDLLQVQEAAPAENPEGAEGGENAESAEGEVAEGEAENQEESQSGSATVGDAGDGHYSLVYTADEEGSSVWYLYDNIEGYRVKVNELIDAARSSDEVNKLVKTSNTYKTILIVLAVVIAALVIAVILLAIKLRDSLYYEDEPEEEFDRYNKAPRRRARDDEEEDEEEEERPRARREVEERTVRPNRDRADAERTVRPSRREEAEERPSRPRRAASYEEERPVRRGAEDRPARPSRREEADERQERQAKRSYRNNDPAADEAREMPRRKTRNFIGDDDDFEFEFLDLDDDK